MYTYIEKRLGLRFTKAPSTAEELTQVFQVYMRVMHQLCSYNHKYTYIYTHIYIYISYIYHIYTYIYIEELTQVLQLIHDSHAFFSECVRHTKKKRMGLGSPTSPAV
jgi:hypothetical protein